MPRRIVVAAVGIPTALGIVYLGGLPLVGLLAVLAAVGTHEYFRLAEAGGMSPIRPIGLFLAVSAPIAVYLVTHGYNLNAWHVLATVVVVFFVTMGAAVFSISPDRAPLPSIAATLFGPLYTGLLPSLLIVIRHSGDYSAWGGTWLVFYPLVMTWVCDSFAMSGGGAIGGPKLAPRVSPNKTWSGAISGVVGAILVSMIFGFFVLGQFGIPILWWQMVVLATIVGLFGQLGDLAESLLKRSVGVKDSGTFFPGHGGVLDRLDSLYWVIPLSALTLHWFAII